MDTRKNIKETAEIPYWRTLRTRSILTLVLAVAYIGVVVISIVSNQAEVSLLERIARGENVTEAEAVSNDNRQALVGVAYLVIYVGVVVTFLFWIYRASKNLAGLGISEPKFSPGGAVGWWFVPIWNLWQPFRVVSEIWEGSHPEGRSRPPMLWVWWMVWLISGWIGTIYFRMFMGNLDTANIEDLILSSQMSIVSDVIAIPATLLLIWVVWRITGNQTKKYAA